MIFVGPAVTMTTTRPLRAVGITVTVTGLYRTVRVTVTVTQLLKPVRVTVTVTVTVTDYSEIFDKHSRYDDYLILCPGLQP